MVETGTGVLPAYTETLRRRPESASDARQLLRLALNVWDLDGVRDAAEMVISELVTNAVVHARRDSIRVTVTRLGADAVRVAVVDMSREHPTPRTPGVNDEGGRGLGIVEALSGGRWGVEPKAWGKQVWADLEVDGTCGG
ncbi:ATP-binding protein [Streptomyces sp. NPDC127037]|uniref:ATP-binding protein n=1 Tax=Streptomyces sp. NPDC127037 TaxID=3347113 RepID=UPI00364C756A